MTEKVDSSVVTSAGARECKAETGEGESAKVFVVGADVGG